MDSNKKYTNIEKIYQSETTLCCRAFDLERKQKVILKLINHEYPSLREKRKLLNEFKIISSLNHKEIIKAYRFEEYEKTYALVLEDIEAKTLDELYTNRKVPLKDFLKISIMLSETIDYIHKNGIIHKDIRPANIILNKSTNEYRIIDFGTSVKSRTENIEASEMDFIDGEFYYIAPEQTGRINISVDYRSDFYSFGITLYKLITGKLPFETNDLLELIHSHIARVPVSPIELDSSIPKPVSDIIMKLIAKKPEERYQSSQGITYDLTLCLAELEEKKCISDFEIGGEDIPELFSIPQKLYGREREIAFIQEVFKRTFGGESELLFVSGDAGVGKTAVIDEIRKNIAVGKLYFVTGKFEQYKRDIPYEPIIKGLQNLIKQLLTETDEELKRWKEIILEKVGKNGKIISEVIPEIELIIGVQPEYEKIGQLENQTRIGNVFSQFASAFSTPERPFVIIMDDVQWVDRPSLLLLENFILNNENKNTFIVGSYRDKEVDESHILHEFMIRLQKNFRKYEMLKIEPLEESVVDELVLDIFKGIEKRDAEELSSICRKKTAGNPFFLRQFMKYLSDNGYFYYNKSKKKWEILIKKIKTADITDNVVEFVLGKIKRLNPKTINLLKLGSCIGNTFDLKTLSLVSETKIVEVEENIKEAIEKEFIVKNENFADDPENYNFKFLHDRVQQAAYMMIKDEQRNELHFKLGMLIYNGVHNIQDRMFDILYHLNKGTEYNRKKENIEIVILMNLNAAKKAKASAAFDAAFGYIMNAVNLLEDNSFSIEYKRSVEIFSEAIEMSFLNNRYELINKFYEKLNNSVKDKFDIMKAREVLIQSLVARGKYKEAIEEGCLILEEFGEKVPTKPNFADVIIKIILTNKLLSKKTTDELYNMPEIKDPNQIYLIRIIKIIMVSAYQTDLNLVVVFIAKMLEITLKYGNSEISPIAYAGYASICRSAFGDIEKAYIYGNLSEKTSIRFGSSINKYSVYMNQGLYILPWKESLKTSVNLFREAYRISYENGDFEFATISAMYYTINSFYLGKPINEIEEQIIADSRKILRMRQKVPNIVNLLNYRLLLDISGNEDKITPLFLREFSKDEMSELEEIKKDKSKYAPMRFMYIMKSYIFEDFDAAEKDIIEALKYMKHLKGTMAEAFVVFYGALIYLSLAKKSIGFDKIKYLNKAKKMEKKIREWSGFAPENFNNKLLLIEAERLSIMNKIPQAIKKYEQSRKLAEENGFLHEKAIAIQLAGEFYKGLGNESIARNYIIKARFEFQNWGALKKVKQLEEKYPYYLSEYKESEKEISYIAKEKSSSSKKITGMLDSISLIKALEAISAEVVFEKLLNKMMEVMIENAGAEKGAFVSISEKGELFLEIKTEIGSIGKIYLPAIHFDEDSEIAASIVRYVVRNRDVVVIDDSTKENMFSGDKYFIDGKAKSILCFPIIGQGRLSGVLYFENSQILGAFTPDRVEILKLLSGQIAISMEISKLYGNLEEKVKDRTKELEIINIVLGEQKKEAVTAKLIADEATKTKSEFLANMSHEIRTPLNGVIGLTYLLKETEINKKQEDYLKKIESSANHLLHVINDVLDFSKIESGRLAIEEHDFELEEIIKQIYGLLMKSCEDKGLKLIHYVDSEIPSILNGDGLRIQQVLINLVGNAVKFTEEGEIVIGIEVVEKKENNIVLKFLVTDTGIGISKEQQERLFKSFTQADGSITRKYGGTGLGLAISKSFVELMGGSIGVISKEGEGSTFCFQLELGIGRTSEIKKTNANGFSIEKTMSKNGMENSTKMLSGKVLLVDDNMINQVIAQEILKSFGLIVDTASGGQEAIDKSISGEYDVILMDIQMPDIDGYEATKQIIKKGIKTPIVAITANAVKGDEEKCLEIGMQDYLAKPINTEKIYKIIEKLISK